MALFKSMHALHLKWLMKQNTNISHLRNLRLCKLYAQHKNKRPTCANERSVQYLYKYWENLFTYSKISEPIASALNIFAYVLGTRKLSEVYNLFNFELNKNQIEQIHQLCQLRLQKMPVQYIIGEWDFRDLTLKMASPVFIPRPETELLVDIVLQYLEKERDYSILEVCCGSGAISLALLKSQPNIKIIAIDQSQAACHLTTTNAGMHHLEERLIVRQYQVSDENRLQTFDEKFDLIVSNPPYVPSSDVLSVQPEIKLFEDLAALDGGADGLTLIKHILKIASEKLKHNGRLFLEIDPSHPALIREICKTQSELTLKYLRTYKDFCNKDRFVAIEKI